MVETHELAGKIGCSLGSVSTTTDWCRPGFLNENNPGVDPESKATLFLIPDQPDERISSALYVLSWAPTVDHLADKLSFRWPLARSGSTTTTNGQPISVQPEGVFSAKGTSPLWVRLEAPVGTSLFVPAKSPDYPLRFDFFSAGTQFFGPPNFFDTEDLARAAFDQPFAFCVTFAYNDAQLPAPACPVA